MAEAEEEEGFEWDEDELTDLLCTIQAEEKVVEEFVGHNKYKAPQRCDRCYILTDQHEPNCIEDQCPNPSLPYGDCCEILREDLADYRVLRDCIEKRQQFDALQQKYEEEKRIYHTDKNKWLQQLQDERVQWQNEMEEAGKRHDAAHKLKRQACRLGLSNLQSRLNDAVEGE